MGIQIWYIYTLKYCIAMRTLTLEKRLGDLEKETQNLILDIVILISLLDIQANVIGFKKLNFRRKIGDEDINLEDITFCMVLKSEDWTTSARGQVYREKMATIRAWGTPKSKFNKIRKVSKES